MKKNCYWKVFFSQTGSEIYEIIRRTGILPDSIITNKPLEDLDKINPDLLNIAFDKLVFIPNKPTVEEYKEVLKHADLVTLHGYLRIVPPEICGRYKIFNGHPGLVSMYPELRGKDPQAKTWWNYADKKYGFYGHVIHEVIPEVDAGNIVSEIKVPCGNLYTEFNSLQSFTYRLHSLSVQNWVDFIKKQYTLIQNQYAF